MRKKDIFRAYVASGYFSPTFNFALKIDGKHIQCCLCGTFVYYRKITRDHIYPKSQGGILKGPACRNCNEVKEDMKPIEWALYAYKHGIDIAVIPIGAEYMMSLIDLLPSKHELYQEMANSINSLLVSSNG